MKVLLFIVVFLYSMSFSAQENSYLHEDYLKIDKENKQNCSKDSIKAIEDSKLQNYYYIIQDSNLEPNYLPTKELSKMLSKQNIKFGGVIIVPLHGSQFYRDKECYFTNINKITKQKYGSKLIEDAILKSYELFAKNNQNKIFEYNDFQSNYKNIYITKNNNIIEEVNFNFWKDFEEPKGYNLRKSGEKTSSIKASFVINRFGKVKSIAINTIFVNKENQKFADFLKKRLTKIIKTQNWEPFNYNGYNVNIKENITINLHLL